MWTKDHRARPCGTITAADRNRALSARCKSAHDLVNARSSACSTSAAILISAAKQSFHPCTIHEARNGGRFFAVAYGPSPSGGAPA